MKLKATKTTSYSAITSHNVYYPQKVKSVLNPSHRPATSQPAAKTLLSQARILRVRHLRTQSHSPYQGLTAPRNVTLSRYLCQTVFYGAYKLVQRLRLAFWPVDNRLLVGVWILSGRINRRFSVMRPFCLPAFQVIELTSTVKIRGFLNKCKKSFIQVSSHSLFFGFKIESYSMLNSLHSFAPVGIKTACQPKPAVRDSYYLAASFMGLAS